MTAWQGVCWSLALVGALIGLYGLHRLCLWLEERGLLFYLRKKPDGAAACFTALQKVIEPQSQHVLHVKEEKRRHGEDEAPGAGDPQATRADRP